MKALTLHLDPFVSYASARGLDIKQLLHERQLTDGIEGADVYIDQRSFNTVLREIRTQLKDTLLGIRVGNLCKLSSLGLIYQISLQCVTVQEALYYLQDFMSKTLPVVTLNITTITDHIVINPSC